MLGKEDPTEVPAAPREMFRGKESVDPWLEPGAEELSSPGCRGCSPAKLTVGR